MKKNSTGFKVEAHINCHVAVYEYNNVSYVLKRVSWLVGFFFFSVYLIIMKLILPEPGKFERHH